MPTKNASRFCALRCLYLVIEVILTQISSSVSPGNDFICAGGKGLRPTPTRPGVRVAVDMRGRCSCCLRICSVKSGGLPCSRVQAGVVDQGAVYLPVFPLPWETFVRTEHACCCSLAPVLRLPELQVIDE